MGIKVNFHQIQAVVHGYNTVRDLIVLDLYYYELWFDSIMVISI